MKNKIKYLLFFLLISTSTFSENKHNNSEKLEELLKEYVEEKKLDEKDIEFINSLLDDKRIKKEVIKYYDKETRKEIRELAKELNVPSEWVYKLFYKESRLNPYATNKISKAQALIQFMPSTAKNLGTSVEELSKMSITEQIPFIKLYLKKINPSLKFDSFTDLYLAVFYPKAIGKIDTYIIGSHIGDEYVEKVAKQNKGIDINKDDSITVGEFSVYANKC